MQNRSGQIKLSVVIPFLNEEENIPLLYDRLSKVLQKETPSWEIVFVDDGSTDGSAGWIAQKAREEQRVKLIRLSRNFGHQIAITAGMDYAQGDAVAIIDADLQDPPEVISDLLAKWREGFDVVYAVRKSRAGETHLKKILAAAFYRIFQHMAEVSVPADTGDFRLIDRKVVDALKSMRELHRFVRGLTSWVGFSQCAVYYDRAARHAGKTKYPFWKSLRLAWDGLTSLSGAPLRFMMTLGIAISCAGFALATKLILSRIFQWGEAVRGWTSLVAIILLLGGAQLICLGLLGQYVSRIFEEAKKRPLYFVKELVGDLSGK